MVKTRNAICGLISSLLILAAGTTQVAAVTVTVFTEDFSNYTPPFSISGNQFTGSSSFSGTQAETGLDVFAGGIVPDWTGAGITHSHAVDLATGIGEEEDNEGQDFALQLFSGGTTTPNTLTQTSGIAANLNGVVYEVSFDAAPTVWQNSSQATSATDGVRVEILRGNNTILASHSYLPGAWTGNASSQDSFSTTSFSYTGDGSGVVRIRLNTEQVSTERYGGAIDNLTIVNDVPELQLTIAATSISEGDGAAATFAFVSRNTDTTASLSVTLASNDTTEATVPTTIIIGAGQTTSAVFFIAAIDDAIVDGTQTVIITASAAGHIDGLDTLEVTDDGANLTLTIVAASVSEGDGAAATTATVSRTSAIAGPLVVTLASSDTTEATVPTTITIAAGQTTSAAFNIAAIDDAIVDGTQTVILTASAVAHADGLITLNVTDNDGAQLLLNIVASLVFEGVGSAGTTGIVSRNGDTTGALVVGLASNDPSELTFPATVTIAAGQSSTNFSIAAVDDSLAKGRRIAIVTATAVAYAKGSDTLFILDNDFPELLLSFAAASVNEGDGSTATSATVSRNTDPFEELLVTLTSSDTSEATVPASITIEAGQSSASFTISAIDDDIIDGPQSVNISASATSHILNTKSLNVLDNDSEDEDEAINQAAIISTVLQYFILD